MVGSISALTTRAHHYIADIAALLALAILPLPAAPQSSPPSKAAGPAVEAALQQAVRDAPEDFDALYALGSFYARHSRLPDAIPLLEKAARLSPQHYECGYDLALAYLQSGQVAGARERLQSMLAREDKAELHNLLGAVEEAAGDPNAAARQMQRAAEIDPSEKHVFDFGNILLRYGAADKSLTILRYGVDKYPRSVRMRVALAAALHALRQYDEAVERLCEAVDLDPTDSRALYFLGQMHDISPSMAGEVTKRLASFVELYPDNASAHYYYAMSLWKGSGQEATESLKRVEELLLKATSLDGRLPEAQLQLGALYERLNRDHDAIRHYEKAVAINPDYEQAYYKLGHAYRRTGQPARAGAALETYQKLHAKNRAKQEQPPALPPGMQAPEQALEQAPEREPEQAPERAPKQAPDQAPK